MKKILVTIAIILAVAALSSAIENASLSSNGFIIALMVVIVGGISTLFIKNLVKGFKKFFKKY